jgi:Cu/Ag efflux protein CusF
MRGICLALLFAVMLAVPAAAHEGHDNRVLGTVAAIDDQSIAITTKEGKTVRVALDEQTVVFRGDEKAARTDIAVGQRAVVSVGSRQNKHVATQIRLGATKK